MLTLETPYFKKTSTQQLYCVWFMVVKCHFGRTDYLIVRYLREWLTFWLNCSAVQETTIYITCKVICGQKYDTVIL